MTAEAIRDAQAEPKPPIKPSALLREQNYGSGEGKRWDSRRIPGLSLDEHFERGIYPVLRGRCERFPGGESLDDLAARANDTIDQILLPHVWDEDNYEAHVAVVSHGLFLAELITALVRQDPAQQTIQPRDFRGMKNTAWTRVRVTAQKSAPGEKPSCKEKLMPLVVQVTNINNSDHLSSLKRQRGGIGSSAHDSRQKDIRGFFKAGAGRTHSQEKNSG
ncbi:hypothetical protein AN958_07731 [Leucoagaricus sp. SymC.cos]|nr:hypothetical protein AN958_07731 [Leucoagaricus sp. SymC.cos]